jgi:hypothetical protein
LPIAQVKRLWRRFGQKGGKRVAAWNARGASNRSKPLKTRHQVQNLIRREYWGSRYSRYVFVAKGRALNEALSPANQQRLSRETDRRVDRWNTPQVSSSRTLDRRE